MVPRTTITLGFVSATSAAATFPGGIVAYLHPIGEHGPKGGERSAAHSSPGAQWTVT